MNEKSDNEMMRHKECASSSTVSDARNMELEEGANIDQQRLSNGGNEIILGIINEEVIERGLVYATGDALDFSWNL